MLVIIIIVTVLIGVAYADYCLIDNTAHFGICFGKVAEDEGAFDAGLTAETAHAVGLAVTEPTAAVQDHDIPGSTSRSPGEAIRIPVRPPRSPAPEWFLLDLEPVLELHEGWNGA
jgi:hypothetical protein